MSKTSLALLAFATAATARTFTVVNKCSYTVWPAVYTTPSGNTGYPDVETGWEAPPGHVKTFTAPDNWRSGRIWGRTGCDFSTSLPGPVQCQTGGCNGGLLCDANTGTGVPPASLAEWTLGGTPPNDGDGIDWYDVSLVDGSNVPMRIEPTGGCHIADCPADLNVGCPDQIAQKDPSGNIVGCKSACMANLDGNTGGDSPLCCSGSHNTPQTCPPSGITYYDHFKNGCPNSYVYAYDESSGTALWTCDTKTGNKPDYTLTFCPGDAAPAPAPPAPTSTEAPAPPAPTSTEAPAPPAPTSTEAPAPPAPTTSTEPAPLPPTSTSQPAPPTSTKTCAPKPTSTLVPVPNTPTVTPTLPPTSAPLPPSSTSQPAPPSSTSKPAPPTSTPTPVPPTSTSKPAPPTSTVKPPPPPTSTSKPAPPTSTVKPPPPTSTTKPAPPTSTSKPAPPTSTVKPPTPSSTSKPTTTTKPSSTSAPTSPAPTTAPQPPKNCPPSRKRAIRKAKRALMMKREMSL